MTSALGFLLGVTLGAAFAFSGLRCVRAHVCLVCWRPRRPTGLLCRKHTEP